MKSLSKVKNLGFAIEEKLHKKMKMYLLESKSDITIKDYVTNLIEKDLRDKSIYKNKEKKMRENN